MTSAGRPNWYLAYSEWRTKTLRGVKRERPSVGWFRQNCHSALIWSLVMRGHYLGDPPAVKDCIKEADCSTGTARKIIFDAEAKGYFVLQSAADDKRRRLIRPSAGCIADYEAHVDLLLRIPALLKDATAAQPSGKRPASRSSPAKK